MAYRRWRPALLLGGLALPLLGGCAEVFKTPLRVGVTSLDLSPLPPFLPKRFLFCEDLQSYLKEPVAFDLMTPRQIRVHLGTGRLKFAMLSAADYAQVAPAGTCEILAVPTNIHKQTYRQGLIIVSPRSRIQSVSELKGGRFHFMPLGDVLNEAALGSLLEAGIDRQQTDRGLLGLALGTSHISSLEVAKSVVLEENTAGVIDEADYNRWPEKGGSLVLLTASKEQVRVIGKTVRVPEGPFVVSKETPKDLADKVQKYLLEMGTKKQIIVGVLGYTGFTTPIDAKQYEPYAAIYRKLHPAAFQAPAEDASAEPASKPGQ